MSHVVMLWILFLKIKFCNFNCVLFGLWACRFETLILSTLAKERYTSIRLREALHAPPRKYQVSLEAIRGTDMLSILRRFP